MHCVCVGLFGALLAALVLLEAGYAMGLRLNFTRSLPLGLYRVVNRPVERGAYVRFCPPRGGAIALGMERGYLHAGEVCANGYLPLLKRVAAVGGAWVLAQDDGVRVDGRLLPLSAHLAVDAAGRPMPRPSPTQLQLAPSQLWVMSDTNSHSFDSRYFGPIDRAWVMEVIEPVATWGPGGTWSG
ncbi:conjugative transfer signal peptidase TraF [Dyella sp. 2RAB6]|uniref:conjugative transfer signal peptidase TraF n=1 Tax=Dyella sp. 2RAB6 TaxID=3232992 RepID=UPI003F9227AC